MITAESVSSPATVKLRDGSLVTIRAVLERDEPQLRGLLLGLCEDSRRLRFFTGGVDVDSAAHWAATEARERYGLLAQDATGGLVAHAVYAQLDGTRAEVAVEVADHLHDQGLGTILIERLASVAEQHGIRQFVAEVLGDNHLMLDVFRDGFDAHVAFRDGVEMVEFPTSAWRVARARFESLPEAQSEIATRSVPAVGRTASVTRLGNAPTG